MKRAAIMAVPNPAAPRNPTVALEGLTIELKSPATMARLPKIK